MEQIGSELEVDRSKKIWLYKSLSMPSENLNSAQVEVKKLKYSNELKRKMIFTGYERALCIGHICDELYTTATLVMRLEKISMKI